MISKRKRRVFEVFGAGRPEQLGVPPGRVLQLSHGSWGGWHRLRPLSTECSKWAGGLERLQRGKHIWKGHLHKAEAHTQREEFPKGFLSLFPFFFDIFFLFCLLNKTIQYQTVTGLATRGIRRPISQLSQLWDGPWAFRTSVGVLKISRIEKKTTSLARSILPFPQKACSTVDSTIVVRIGFAETGYAALYQKAVGAFAELLRRDWPGTQPRKVQVVWSGNIIV